MMSVNVISTAILIILAMIGYLYYCFSPNKYLILIWLKKRAFFFYFGFSIAGLILLIFKFMGVGLILIAIGVGVSFIQRM